MGRILLCVFYFFLTVGFTDGLFNLPLPPVPSQLFDEYDKYSITTSTSKTPSEHHLLESKSENSLLPTTKDKHLSFEFKSSSTYSLPSTFQNKHQSLESKSSSTYSLPSTIKDKNTSAEVKSSRLHTLQNITSSIHHSKELSAKEDRIFQYKTNENDLKQTNGYEYKSEKKSENNSVPIPSLPKPISQSNLLNKIIYIRPLESSSNAFKGDSVIIPHTTDTKIKAIKEVKKATNNEIRKDSTLQRKRTSLKKRKVGKTYNKPSLWKPTRARAPPMDSSQHDKKINKTVSEHFLVKSKTIPTFDFPQNHGKVEKTDNDNFLQKPTTFSPRDLSQDIKIEKTNNNNFLMKPSTFSPFNSLQKNLKTEKKSNDHSFGKPTTFSPVELVQHHAMNEITTIVNFIRKPTTSSPVYFSQYDAEIEKTGNYHFIRKSPTFSAFELTKHDTSAVKYPFISTSTTSSPTETLNLNPDGSDIIPFIDTFKRNEKLSKQRKNLRVIQTMLSLAPEGEQRNKLLELANKILYDMDSYTESSTVANEMTNEKKYIEQVPTIVPSIHQDNHLYKNNHQKSDPKSELFTTRQFQAEQNENNINTMGVFIPENALTHSSSNQKQEPMPAILKANAVKDNSEVIRNNAVPRLGKKPKGITNGQKDAVFQSIDGVGSIGGIRNTDVVPMSSGLHIETPGTKNINQDNANTANKISGAPPDLSHATLVNYGHKSDLDFTTTPPYDIRNSAYKNPRTFTDTNNIAADFKTIYPTHAMPSAAQLGIERFSPHSSEITTNQHESSNSNYMYNIDKHNSFNIKPGNSDPAYPSEIDIRTNKKISGANAYGYYQHPHETKGNNHLLHGTQGSATKNEHKYDQPLRETNRDGSANVYGTDEPLRESQKNGSTNVYKYDQQLYQTQGNGLTNAYGNDQSLHDTTGSGTTNAYRNDQPLHGSQSSRSINIHKHHQPLHATKESGSTNVYGTDQHGTQVSGLKNTLYEKLFPTDTVSFDKNSYTSSSDFSNPLQSNLILPGQMELNEYVGNTKHVPATNNEFHFSDGRNSIDGKIQKETHSLSPPKHVSDANMFVKYSSDINTNHSEIHDQMNAMQVKKINSYKPDNLYLNSAQIFPDYFHRDKMTQNQNVDKQDPYQKDHKAISQTNTYQTEPNVQWFNGDQAISAKSIANVSANMDIKRSGKVQENVDQNMFNAIQSSPPSTQREDANLQTFDNTLQTTANTARYFNSQKGHQTDTNSKAFRIIPKSRFITTTPTTVDVPSSNSVFKETKNKEQTLPYNFGSVYASDNSVDQQGHWYKDMMPISYSDMKLIHENNDLNSIRSFTKGAQQNLFTIPLNRIDINKNHVNESQFAFNNQGDTGISRTVPKQNLNTQDGKGSSINVTPDHLNAQASTDTSTKVFPHDVISQTGAGNSMNSKPHNLNIQNPFAQSTDIQTRNSDITSYTDISMHAPTYDFKQKSSTHSSRNVSFHDKNTQKGNNISMKAHDLNSLSAAENSMIVPPVDLNTKIGNGNSIDMLPRDFNLQNKYKKSNGLLPYFTKSRNTDSYTSEALLPNEGDSQRKQYTQDMLINDRNIQNDNRHATKELIPGVIIKTGSTYDTGKQSQDTTFKGSGKSSDSTYNTEENLQSSTKHDTNGLFPGSTYKQEMPISRSTLNTDGLLTGTFRANGESSKSTFKSNLQSQGSIFSTDGQLAGSTHNLDKNSAARIYNRDEKSPGSTFNTDGSTYNTNGQTAGSIYTGNGQSPVSTFNTNRESPVSTYNTDGKSVSRIYDKDLSLPASTNDTFKQSPSNTYNTNEQSPDNTYNIDWQSTGTKGGQVPGSTYNTFGQSPDNTYITGRQSAGSIYNKDGQSPGSTYNMNGQSPVSTNTNDGKSPGNIHNTDQQSFGSTNKKNGQLIDSTYNTNGQSPDRIYSTDGHFGGSFYNENGKSPGTTYNVGVQSPDSTYKMEGKSPSSTYKIAEWSPESTYNTNGMSPSSTNNANGKSPDIKYKMEGQSSSGTYNTNELSAGNTFNSNGKSPDSTNKMEQKWSSSTYNASRQSLGSTYNKNRLVPGSTHHMDNMDRMSYDVNIQNNIRKTFNEPTLPDTNNKPDKMYSSHFPQPNIQSGYGNRVGVLAHNENRDNEKTPVAQPHNDLKHNVSNENGFTLQVLPHDVSTPYNGNTQDTLSKDVQKYNMNSGSGHKPNALLNDIPEHINVNNGNTHNMLQYDDPTLNVKSVNGNTRKALLHDTQPYNVHNRDGNMRDELRNDVPTHNVNRGYENTHDAQPHDVPTYNANEGNGNRREAVPSNIQTHNVNSNIPVTHNTLPYHPINQNVNSGRGKMHDELRHEKLAHSARSGNGNERDTRSHDFTVHKAKSGSGNNGNLIRHGLNIPGGNTHTTVIPPYDEKFDRGNSNPLEMSRGVNIESSTTTNNDIHSPDINAQSGISRKPSFSSNNINTQNEHRHNMDVHPYDINADSGKPNAMNSEFHELNNQNGNEKVRAILAHSTNADNGKASFSNDYGNNMNVLPSDVNADRRGSNAMDVLPHNIQKDIFITKSPSKKIGTNTEREALLSDHKTAPGVDFPEIAIYSSTGQLNNEKGKHLNLKNIIRKGSNIHDISDIGNTLNSNNKMDVNGHKAGGKYGRERKKMGIFPAQSPHEYYNNNNKKPYDVPINDNNFNDIPKEYQKNSHRLTRQKYPSLKRRNNIPWLKKSEFVTQYEASHRPSKPEVKHRIEHDIPSSQSVQEQLPYKKLTEPSIPKLKNDYTSNKELPRHNLRRNEGQTTSKHNDRDSLQGLRNERANIKEDKPYQPLYNPLRSSKNKDISEISSRQRQIRPIDKSLHSYLFPHKESTNGNADAYTRDRIRSETPIERNIFKERGPMKIKEHAPSFSNGRIDSRYSNKEPEHHISLNIVRKGENTLDNKANSIQIHMNFGHQQSPERKRIENGKSYAPDALRHEGTRNLDTESTNYEPNYEPNSVSLPFHNREKWNDRRRSRYDSLSSYNTHQSMQMNNDNKILNQGVFRANAREARLNERTDGVLRNVPERREYVGQEAHNEKLPAEYNEINGNKRSYNGENERNKDTRIDSSFTAYSKNKNYQETNNKNMDMGTNRRPTAYSERGDFREINNRNIDTRTDRRYRVNSERVDYPGTISRNMDLKRERNSKVYSERGDYPRKNNRNKDTNRDRSSTGYSEHGDNYGRINRNMDAKKDIGAIFHSDRVETNNRNIDKRNDRGFRANSDRGDYPQTKPRKLDTRQDSSSFKSERSDYRGRNNRNIERSNSDYSENGNYQGTDTRYMETRKDRSSTSYPERRGYRSRDVIFDSQSALQSGRNRNSERNSDSQAKHRHRQVLNKERQRRRYKNEDGINDYNRFHLDQNNEAESTYRNTRRKSNDRSKNSLDGNNDYEPYHSPQPDGQVRNPNDMEVHNHQSITNKGSETYPDNAFSNNDYDYHSIKQGQTLVSATAGSAYQRVKNYGDIPSNDVEVKKATPRLMPSWGSNTQQRRAWNTPNPFSRRNRLHGRGLISHHKRGRTKSWHRKKGKKNKSTESKNLSAEKAKQKRGPIPDSPYADFPL